MTTVLTDEQSMLRESAQRFVENEYSFEARRALVASDEGFSRAHWKQFAELGWLAMPLPEAHGGLGGGAVETAVLMEVFGRGLVVEPFFATIVLGAGLVADAGSAAQQAEILPAVAEGGMLLAFAHGEPTSRFDLNAVATTAEKKGSGYTLTGHKAVAWHAGAADKLIVSARSDGGERDEAGITLYLVDPKAKGVTIRGYATNDGQRAGEVILDGVEASAGDVLGEPGGAYPAIAAAVDRAMIALGAEACGAMAALVEQTQEYLKTRQQFGVPLSKFQVLQHRLVEMFNEQAMSRAVVYRAAASIGSAGAATRARAAAAAKAQIGKSGKFVGQQAVQLHGGMGMTDELPVGHYFKRLSMIDVAFGNAEYHRRRFARM
ncbi:MAG TPA: acyl-CoA dehydrogenase family protein [Alphaproteobacteria bacterium]|nr:acyl-CoA dehydrogenase family protein [Alphaproteobacteria bacterium]